MNSANIAVRSRHKRRIAVAHGPRLLRAVFKVKSVKFWALFHPRLSDHPIKLIIELEIAKALGHEIQMLWCKHGCGG